MQPSANSELGWVGCWLGLPLHRDDVGDYDAPAVGTDIELLEGWRRGDARAGEQLFDRHVDRLYRFFCNKVDDGIDDLIQQTCLACLESHERYRGDGAFSAFVLGIARNVLRGHYRARRKGKNIDFGVTSIRDLATSPSAVAARLGDQRALLDALRRLPVDLQIALELHYWEEMTVAHIAEVLEVTLGTAKARLRKAKQLLQAQVEALEVPSQLEATVENLENWARKVRNRLERPDPIT